MLIYLDGGAWAAAQKPIEMKPSYWHLRAARALTGIEDV
jgi:hypothetical protein